jgi:hypothetical protein
MKTTEEEKVGICSLAHNISGVEEQARASGWGLRGVTSKSIVHMNLYKPNNKLVSVWLKHFWCTNEPHAYTNAQGSPRLGFGGSHHLPPL